MSKVEKNGQISFTAKELAEQLGFASATIGRYRVFFDKKQCPECKKFYIGIGALSRKDNETEICSQCGIEQLLYDFSTTY